MFLVLLSLAIDTITLEMYKLYKIKRPYTSYLCTEIPIKSKTIWSSSALDIDNAVRYTINNALRYI